MDVEILPRDASEGVSLRGTRTLGLLGTALALLTTLAAFGVGILALFGKLLAAAAVVTLAWPLVFSPQFTAWVFGAERVPFWKVFLLLLAAGAVVKTLRRQSWQRK